MKYLQQASAAALYALLLMGCTNKEEPTGVIPQGYQDAVKKAGSVENKLQDAAQQQLQELDQGSQ
jgi:uncharacterized lipoprotein NlpE involved in copper resistance